VASVQNNSRIWPTISPRHYLKVCVCPSILSLVCNTKYSNAHWLWAYRAEPVKGATLTVQSGPVELFEGRMLVLHCNVTSGNHVSYTWLLDDRPLPASSVFHHAHKELFIYRSAYTDWRLLLYARHLTAK